MTLTWWPTSCALQLNLSKASPEGVLKAGCSYTGTSTIRYVKREYAWSSPPERTETPETLTQASSLSAYDQFLRNTATVSGKNGEGGLPLHAYTQASPRYPAVTPLQVQSYRVTDAAGHLLKLLSVFEVDAAPGAGKTIPNTAKPTTKGKTKTPGKRNGKDGGPDGTEALAHSGGGADDEDAVNVLGAKWVRFQEAETLPVGSEVELTVTFTGTIQQGDQGGIYASPGSADGEAVLTHFEVSLARFAFPCPDHPQYRLDWQLKTLQLPQAYTQVVTNGTELLRKVLSAQGAVQYSFSACGPMPAYVLAFACFRATVAGGDASQPLRSCETVVRIPPASAYTTQAEGGVPAAEAGDAALVIPLRVLASRQSGIDEAVLERTLHTAKEAVRYLQDFFQCPLPLLQCEHLDILLAPTMPYISGMEHHCCIFLNESIFQSKGKKGSSGGGGNALDEQTALIVHELAHHWAGNALGLPFSVKEGICQLLEKCVGDVVSGRPMRKYHAGESAPDAQPEETVQGKEFTGHTYQHALLALQRLVATVGFPHFEGRCRELARAYLLEPMTQEEDYGGLETLRLSTTADQWPCPPYLSASAAMQLLHGGSS